MPYDLATQFLWTNIFGPKYHVIKLRVSIFYICPLVLVIALRLVFKIETSIVFLEIVIIPFDFLLGCLPSIHRTLLQYFEGSLVEGRLIPIRINRHDNNLTFV